MGDDYTFAIEHQRKEKDHWFKDGHQSPIPHHERASFTGLKYFPVNRDLRFRLKLNVFPKQEVLHFPTSKGTEQPYLRYGYFEFQVGAETVRLHAYKSAHAHGHESLFIPFRDETNKKETYAAGRYLDLEVQRSGVYDLDLNLAYNPYCVFSEEYVCPLPPPENWLPVPIHAGEKNWP